jgi:hypothetical protein
MTASQDGMSSQNRRQGRQIGAAIHNPPGPVTTSVFFKGLGFSLFLATWWLRGAGPVQNW